MHIRRALLLFAIVLGMAALVASLSRPDDERSANTQRKPAAAPTIVATPPTDSPRRPVSFDALSDRRRRVPAGHAATLEVSVDEPGTVEVPGLALIASANQHTPARFDVFLTRAARYEILFTPAHGDQSRSAGTLVVTASG